MIRRIRRKFKTKVEQDQVAELAQYYKEVYRYGQLVLSEFLNPPSGKYRDSSDVDMDSFIDRLLEQYSDEDLEIIKNIAGWVVYYEYLR
jgi:hypothetical protein